MTNRQLKVEITNLGQIEKQVDRPERRKKCPRCLRVYSFKDTLRTIPEPKQCPECDMEQAATQETT